jgi:hypothetical protein
MQPVTSARTAARGAIGLAGASAVALVIACFVHAWLVFPIDTLGFSPMSFAGCLHGECVTKPNFELLQVDAQGETRGCGGSPLRRASSRPAHWP